MLSIFRPNRAPIELIKDMVTYAWAKAIPGLAGFFGVLLFIHWLGTEEFGKYSLAFSFVNMCTAFSFAWFNQSIIRYFSKLRIEGILNSVVSGGWLFSVLITIGLILGSQLINFPEVSSISLLLVLSIAIGTFSMVLVLLQSNRQASKVVQMNILQAALFIFGPFFIVTYFGKTHESVLGGLIFSYTVPVILFFWIRGIGFWNFEYDKISSSLKKLFLFGYPLSLWFASSLSLRFLDRYFLEYFLGLEQMGSYAGYTEIFTRLFSLILFPITMALHPYLTHQWNNGQEKLVIKTLKWGLVLQGGIFVLVFLFLFVFQEWILSMLAIIAPGLNAEMNHVVLPIFIGGFLWQWSLLIHKPLELMEKTNHMLIFMFGAVAINIIGNILFLPKIGAIATAYTLIASALGYNLLVCIASRKFWIGKFQP